MAATTASLAIEHYTGKAVTVLYALAAWVAFSAALGLVLGPLLRDRAAAYPELADPAGERLADRVTGEVDALMRAYDGQNRP